MSRQAVEIAVFLVSSFTWLHYATSYLARNFIPPGLGLIDGFCGLSSIHSYRECKAGEFGEW